MPVSVGLSEGQKFELRCLGTYTQMKNLPVVNFRDAVEAIKHTQSPDWNPEDPPTLFGKGLLRMVGKLLDAMLDAIRTEPDSSRKYRLRLYVAVGTPLDGHHGTDAVLALEDVELEHELIVTIDLTRNLGKVHGKADMVLGFDEVLAIERAARQPFGEIQPTKMAKEIASLLWIYWYNFVQISGGNYDLKTQPLNIR